MVSSSLVDGSGGFEEAPLDGVGCGGSVAEAEPVPERGEEGLGQDAQDDVEVDVEVDCRGQGVPCATVKGYLLSA